MTLRPLRDDDSVPDVKSELAKARQRIAELEAKLAQATPHTSVLELTVQSTTTAGQYRVKAEWNRPGDPVVCERLLTLDEEALSVAASNALKYGTALGEALFADGVRDLFVLARGDDTALRVLLAVEAVELQRLRWDRLCGPFGDKDWRLLRPNLLTPFSLYIPSTTDRRYPPFRQDELRALVVVASPAQGNPMVSWFDEAIALDTVLQGLGDIPSVVLSHVEGRSAGPPTLTEICQQLSTGGFTLLHMIFHGAARKNGETVLFLEADEALPLQVERAGKTAAVPASLLIERLGELGKGKALPHFAFLSVCDSGVVGEETAAPATGDWRDTLRSLGHRMVKDLGMKSVLAMTDKISQTTALALGRSFYPALLRHGEADVALAEACIAVREQRDVTTPTLFNRVVGRRLFSASSAARPLTDAEVEGGRQQLATYFAERAPVLLREPLSARSLEELERLCEEVLDVSFTELARGEKKPPKYNGECPFPGLRAFTSAQRKYFRGRDALVASLVERLKTQSFVCVLGSSGSGKSSAVAAGVIPALLEKQRELKTARMTPGSTPLVSLDRALETFGGAAESLLYIDQFEETFTLCTDAEARRCFLDRIVEMARPERRVIMTMRADFFGECATHAGLRRAVQRQPELVPPMAPDELRGAVEAQAREAGLRYETGLSERILAELVTEPGAMPLLQHALAELWERRHGRWLRRTAWETDIGGVAGAIEKTAEDVWKGLDAEERALLPGIMTRLTRVGGADEDGGPTRDTRQRAGIDSLYPKDSVEGQKQQVERLIEKLAGEGARLLVTSRDERTGKKRVEVAHEALLSHWKRLRDWIQEAREVLLMEQDLRATALEWLNKRKQGGAYLEHRGARADAVREMMKGRGLTLDEQELRATKGAAKGEPPPLVGSVKEYFEACQAEDARLERERQEAERRLTQQVAEFYAQKGIALYHDGDPSAAVVYLNKALAMGGDGFSLRLHHARAAHDSLDLVLARFEGNCAAFDDGGARVVTTGTDNVVRVWDVRSGALLASMRGHTALVHRALFSRDGTSVVTTSDDRTTRIWDARSGEARLTLERPESYPYSAAFSPDGASILTADSDSVARLWDARTGEELAALSGHEEGLVFAAFSVDGARIVTSSSDHTSRVWRADTRKEVALLREPGDAWARRAAFSPDGQRVVTGCDDHRARVWDVASCTVIAALEGSEGELWSVAFSPDGKRVVTGGADGDARIWDVETQAEVASLKGGRGLLYSAAFSPDGSRVLTASWDGTTLLWNATPRRRMTVLTKGKDSLASAAFSPDGGFVIAHTACFAYVWYLGTRAEVAAYETQNHPVRSAFSPNGERVVIASDDHIAVVWDVSDRNNRRRVSTLIGHTAPISSAVLTPDGKRVLTLSDGAARLWNADDGALIAALDGHAGPVRGAAFSHNGWAVTASDDHTARMWNAQDGAPDAALIGHTGPVRSAAFNAGTTHVVTASDDGTARLWNATDGAEQRKFEGHAGPVIGAAFSADGARVVTASEDGTARVWDATGAREPYVLRGHEGPVLSATFEPDSGRVLTVGVDGTARLWDEHGKEIVTLTGHEGPVRSAAFHPDGKRAVTAGDDGTARLWNLEGAPVEEGTPATEPPPEQSASGPDGVRIVVAGDDHTASVWDVSDPDNRRKISDLMGHDAAFSSAVFTPDGKRVVTVGEDGAERRWDLEGAPDEQGTPAPIGREVDCSREHNGAVNSVAFSPDGATVLTSGADGNTWLWSVGGETSYLDTATEAVLAVAFTGLAARVVTRRRDGRSLVRDLRTGAELVALEGRAPEGNAAFDPGGARLVLTGADNVVRVMDADTGAPITELRGHTDTVNSGAFSRDGGRLVTSSGDSTRVWDASTGKEIAAFQASAWDAVPNSDGRRIVTLALYRTVRLWDVDARKEIAALKGHTDEVKCAAFSVDGALLVTGSDDGTARLWDGVTGEAVATLEGHGALTSVAFSDDGASVVTADNAGVLRVWDLSPDPRPPEEIDGLIRERLGLELVDGKLRPVQRQATPSEAPAAR